MASVQQADKAPTLVNELETTVSDILSSATITDSSKVVAAAKVLGIDAQSIKIADPEQSVQGAFADAIEPIKLALEKKPQTRANVTELNKANAVLEQLIAINEGRTTPATEVTADTILQGFKKLDNGVYELTLPVGTAIQEAGRILNGAAKAKGMKFPVFCEDNAEFWAKNEANQELQTKPGKTYQFQIPTDSVSKTKAKQINDHGEGAPLGAIAIAEACERLNTQNQASLFFNDKDGDKLWVRGSAPGVALVSLSDLGVYVLGFSDVSSYYLIAFAPSVGARNKNS